MNSEKWNNTIFKGNNCFALGILFILGILGISECNWILLNNSHFKKVVGIINLYLI